jgi:hypothetical protein
MKKFYLKGLKKVMSNSELRDVLGGAVDPGSGTYYNYDYLGTCGWTGHTYSAFNKVISVSGCNVSKSYAMDMASYYSGSWCCDNVLRLAIVALLVLHYSARVVY